MLKCNMCGLLALTFSKYVANAGYCDPFLCFLNAGARASHELHVLLLSVAVVHLLSDPIIRLHMSPTPSSLRSVLLPTGRQHLQLPLEVNGA